MPASRPKVTRWGTYYGKNYRRWRDQAQILLREEKSGPEKMAGPLAVLTEIISPRPKTTKRQFPHGDNDNFEKAAWDAVTKSDRWWVDDDQIVFNVTWKRYAADNETPTTRIHIFQLKDGSNV